MQCNPGDTAPDFSLPDAAGTTVSLSDFKGRPLVLVFSRYVGCPVCQMTSFELTRAAPDFDRAGAALAIVFQSSPERLSAFARHSHDAVFDGGGATPRLPTLELRIVHT